MAEQQPSVGRIVHVVGHNGECQAAIITEHGVTAGPASGQIAAMLFPARSSPYPLRAVAYFAGGPSITSPPNSWHWPERE